MSETSLHAALKDWYTQAGDRQEVNIDGYYIDVVTEQALIEIQTRHFGAMKAKLAALLDRHAMCVVHPIAAEKWLAYLPENPGLPVTRRKSPRKGRFEEIFHELVRFPELLAHPNFSLEVLLVREEEVRRADGRGSWRRGGVSIVDRRLIEIVDRRIIRQPGDLRQFLPAGLSQPFTNADLARSLRIPQRLAGRMTFCLRSLQVLQPGGKRGRSLLFEIQSSRGETP
ncbi:MAG: hypothetical protein ACKOC5_19305 [Chloroflexota bacterium]